jgi:hypothetical protein
MEKNFGRGSCLRKPRQELAGSQYIKKGDRLFLGQFSSDEGGQKWIEAETAQGAFGFIPKSSPVIDPSPALSFSLLGGVAVLIGGAVYWIVESGVSISKLAMIALGIFGALGALSKRK